MLHGSGGSAKTFLEELIKTVVDPSVIKTLTFLRDLNELIQQLSHNHVVYYDNISEMPDWISDQLCRAVTGSGSSKRALYTDDDDFIRSFIRCVMSCRLKEVETNLKEFGIEIEWGHDKDKRRIIKIRKIAQVALVALEAKNQAQKQQKNGDTTGDATEQV